MTYFPALSFLYTYKHAFSPYQKCSDAHTHTQAQLHRFFAIAVIEIKGFAIYIPAAYCKKDTRARYQNSSIVENIIYIYIYLYHMLSQRIDTYLRTKKQKKNYQKTGDGMYIRLNSGSPCSFTQ